jgi:hypothetical protein
VGDKPRFELRVTAASEIQNLAVTMARALEGGQGKKKCCSSVQEQLTCPLSNMHAALVCDLHDGFVSSNFFSLISRVNTVAPLKEKTVGTRLSKFKNVFFLGVTGIRIPASAPPRPTAASERTDAYARPATAPTGKGPRGWPTPITYSPVPTGGASLGPASRGHALPWCKKVFKDLVGK